MGGPLGSRHEGQRSAGSELQRAGETEFEKTLIVLVRRAGSEKTLVGAQGRGVMNLNSGGKGGGQKGRKLFKKTTDDLGDDGGPRRQDFLSSCFMGEMGFAGTQERLEKN